MPPAPYLWAWKPALALSSRGVNRKPLPNMRSQVKEKGEQHFYNAVTKLLLKKEESA